MIEAIEADMATMGPSVIIFCLSLVAFSLAREYVPVLLLQSPDSGPNESGVSALTKWNSEDFKKYMLKLVSRNEDKTKPPMVVVFAEESLSVEDFSWAGAGDFSRLLNESKTSSSTFFPAIHQPLKALEGLKDSGFKWFKYPATQVSKLIDSGKEENIFSKLSKDVKGIVLVIDLEDASIAEDRPDMLRRHDAFIVDTYDKLKADRDVIAVYTADHSSWYESEEGEALASLSDYDDDGREVRSSARHLLVISEPSNTTYVIYTPSKDSLLYLDSAPVLVSPEYPSGLTLTGVTVVSQDSRSNFTRMVINYKQDGQQIGLRIKFESKRNYWNLPSMELESDSTKINLIPDKVIEAPVGFSYHCSQNITFENGTSKVIFQGMQVQGYMKDNTAFGDGYDCVYFFTAAIWSGLFVTMLLAFIMIWGLSMIMDIRTMDRFDDPKGKTITIGNAE